MKPHAWLAPLVPVYGALVRVKNAAYDRGLFSAEKLNAKVISVGNLSTGGSGKTPLVIALVRLLQQDGISVDVLSRGYGRTSDATLQVMTGYDDAAALYGDEPLLIANATNAPVFVGRSRLAAGQLAEEARLPAEGHIHLLDDGFQHRQLARDLDIVVLHPSDLVEHLLPAGHLRESLASLARAHVVVVRKDDESMLPKIQKHLHAGSQVWKIARTLVCEPPKQTAVAFCGIARPDEFFAGLRLLDIDLAATIAYPDHHGYGEADIRHLIGRCRDANVFHLITTEKDLMRFGPQACEMFGESISLTAAVLKVDFLEPEVVLATIRKVLGEK